MQNTSSLREASIYNNRDFGFFDNPTSFENITDDLDYKSSLCTESLIAHTRNLLQESNNKVNNNDTDYFGEVINLSNKLATNSKLPLLDDAEERIIALQYAFKHQNDFLQIPSSTSTPKEMGAKRRNFSSCNILEQVIDFPVNPKSKILLLWNLLKNKKNYSIPNPAISTSDDGKDAICVIDNDCDVFEFEFVDDKIELFYYNRETKICWEKEYNTIVEVFNDSHCYSKFLDKAIS